MEWQTPADQHWANNYTVTCHARIAGGRPKITYCAMHLPTQHTEDAATRSEALKRLTRWIETQTPPRKPAQDRSGPDPYGAQARHKALAARMAALQGGVNENA